MSDMPVMPGNGIESHWSGCAVPSPEIERSTSIAVNLGGAVIPVVMSVFLSTMVSLIDVLIY